MAKPGRPRKKRDEAKNDYLEIRVDSSEKETFKKAADAAGMAVSAWVRDRLRKVARKELEGEGLSIPFVERLSA